MKDHAAVTYISECFMKPKVQEVEDWENHYCLTPWGLPYLSRQYIQRGLLFARPLSSNLDIDKLKHSFSSALVHFYPLAGQLITKLDVENPSKYCYTFIDCNKGPGAKFIHAMSKILSVSNIQSLNVAPEGIRALFDHNRTFNSEAHHTSILSVQLTELLDGVFIGCSANHAVVDGVTFWHFFNTWSEIYAKDCMETSEVVISKEPIHQQPWEMFPGENFPKELCIPILRPSEFMIDQQELILREFRFSRESMAKLKAMANAVLEKVESKKEISSFQALAGLVWRAVTRARGIKNQQESTVCYLAGNNRGRLIPPLSPDYFGCCEQSIITRTTVYQLIHEYGLGEVAALLNTAVAERDDGQVREYVEKWVKAPYFYPPAPAGGVGNGVSIGSSPRFNMYGNEFGMGRPVAVRSGFGNMYDGKVAANEGSEGSGSVDLEICLGPHSMKALESDPEFMAALH